MGIKIEKVGQLAVAATAQLERLQSGIETALLLIERTIEQQDGRFDFLGGKLQHSRIRHGGQEFHGTTRQKLSSLEGRIRTGRKRAGGKRGLAESVDAGRPALRRVRWEPIHRRSIRGESDSR